MSNKVICEKAYLCSNVVDCAHFEPHKTMLINHDIECSVISKCYSHNDESVQCVDIKVYEQRKKLKRYRMIVKG